MVNGTREADIEEQIREAERVPFIYQPIGHDEAYSRERFLDAESKLISLMQYRTALGKNPHDLDARQGLSEILTGSSNFHVGLSPEFVTSASRVYYESGAEAMARYVGRDRETFLSLLGPDAFYRLALSLPLIKTGNKIHDSLVSIISDIREMTQIHKEKNLDAMKTYVLRKTEEDIGDEAKKLILYFADDEIFIRKVFEREFLMKQHILNSALTEKGKPNVEKVRKFISDSIHKAEDELIKDNNIWKKALRPYYEGIAEQAYHSIQAS